LFNAVNLRYTLIFRHIGLFIFTMTTIQSIAPHVFHVSDKTNWFFISVRLENGIIGWGEASLNSWEAMIEVLVHERLSHLKGLTIKEAQSQLRVSPRSPGGLLMGAAVSATQQALCDAESQTQQVALHSILGSRVRDQVPVYANINRATSLRTPEGFVKVASKAKNDGFEAFKIAPFDGVFPWNCSTSEGKEKIKKGLDCIFAVSEFLSPVARLMVDCHWRFDEKAAIEVLGILKDTPLYWFECPIAETYENWDAMRRVKAIANEQNTLIAAAESQIGLSSFVMLMQEKLYDVIMPDVKYCGGPRELLEIAKAAQEAGVQFAPHNPTGPICHYQSLHVCAVSPECLYLEMQYDESSLFDELVKNQSSRVVNSHLELPQALGLGVQMDTGLLKLHPYQPVPPGIDTLLNS
jgi:galactonate dehydratase